MWDSALVLVRFLLEHQESTIGEKVLELGAGTGAVGILAATLPQPRFVDVTDLSQALALIRANVELNEEKIKSTINVFECSWGCNKLTKTYDTILMSDVVYAPEAYAPLVTTLQEVCSSSGNCKVIWSHRHRNPDDHQFFKLLSGHFNTKILKGPGPKFIGVDLPDLELMFKRGTLDSRPKSMANHTSSDVTVYLSTLKMDE